MKLKTVSNIGTLSSIVGLFAGAFWLTFKLLYWLIPATKSPAILCMIKYRSDIFLIVVITVNICASVAMIMLSMALKSKANSGAS